MKKCVVLLSFIVSTILVLASCAAETTTTTPKSITPLTTTPSGTTKTSTTTAASETPQYGGVVIIPLAQDILNFEEMYGWHPGAALLKLTNEELVTGDWTRGPAGTNECDWAIRGTDRFSQKAGALAESWEYPEMGKAIYHIRKGISWALNPNSEASRLVGGREFNAQDVAWTLQTYITFTRSYLYSQPGLKNAIITTPDDWTVEIEIAPEYFEAGIARFQDFASIVPHEVVEKYGSMQDWRTSVGTGAFILTDYVPGSSATLERNRNYWQKDPIGPGKGNQLPYLDGVKYVIITDASTTQSAFRTAKIDVFASADWETGTILTNENPALLFKKHTQDTTPNNTHMRTDKAPFNDIRVRRALFMATDFNAIKNDLFGGEADIITWPLTPVREYKEAFLSLEEAPDSVKELYIYDPAKAKALLSEAGYPDGLKVTIIAQNITDRVDYYSVIKEMWSKVNVEVTIDLKEAAVWESITGARNYEQMIHSHTAPCGSIYRMINYRGIGRTNGSYINDAYVEEMYPKIQVAYITNPPEADRLHKELMKYVLEQAWVIPTPLPPLWHIWWPWVKNFHGELSPGYDNSFKFTYFSWINRDLKESMTGKR